MKTTKVLLSALLITFSMTVFAQSDSTTFKVAGNCGMCKKRIETSVKGPAVSMADWNIKSKMLTIKFDPAKTSMDQLQQKIAVAGHDTRKFKADKAVYEELPGCCLYDRTMVNDGDKISTDRSGH